eukprot:9938250-Prorocentrum_lima.AAC.1
MYWREGSKVRRNSAWCGWQGAEGGTQDGGLIVLPLATAGPHRSSRWCMQPCRCSNVHGLQPVRGSCIRLR